MQQEFKVYSSSSTMVFNLDQWRNLHTEQGFACKNCENWTDSSYPGMGECGTGSEPFLGHRNFVSADHFCASFTPKEQDNG